MANKYNAKKITVDGQTFDSRKEARRYKELTLLQQAGKIRDLQTQVKFPLIPAQKDGKKTIERECAYIADFVYRDENCRLVVEDVKGYRKGGAYSVFVIKRKLMLQRYGIRVREV